MKFLVLILILLPAFIQAEKCRALVLEGGGDKGAYQVGAIRGLYEKLGQAEGTYDVLSGVSIGSMNSFAYSLHPAGREDETTRWLRKHF